MIAHCPPQEQLERLLDDRLETIEDSVLARHVESCTGCQSRLEGLLAGSRSPRGPAQTDPEVADAMLSRLKKRGRPRDETIQHAEKQPLANQPGKGAGSLPVVPGYEVLSEIGRGGMGVVYQARQLGLNRRVALKMIHAGGHSGRDAFARFRAEAESVARLVHPNIVQIYEIGEHDGCPFFSQEYVAGGSLAGRLGGVPQSARASASFVETLAGAVHYAHQQGIVHRDLKPDNILLVSGGVVRGEGSGADTTHHSPRTNRRSPTSAWPSSSTAIRAKRKPAPSWARRATWPPSRPTGARPRSGRRPTCTRWGRSCTRC